MSTNAGRSTSATAFGVGATAAIMPPAGSAGSAGPRPANDADAAARSARGPRGSEGRIAPLHRLDPWDRHICSVAAERVHSSVVAQLRTCGHEVLAAHEREPGERADERGDRRDDEDLVQRAGEAGVERFDE